MYLLMRMTRFSPSYTEGRATAEGLRDRFRTFDGASSPRSRSNVDPVDAVSSTDENPATSTMNGPTREEVDAKLLLIETRMDGRVASIERSVANAISAVSETRGDIKNLKWTMVATAIATVLGIAAFNATVLSNMVASFESGKNTAAAQAEVKKQSEETAALIKKMQEDLDARRAAQSRN